MSVYKFMSMNMLTDVLYNYGDSRFKCRAEAIHEMLRQTKPDVIGVQELFLQAKTAGGTYYKYLESYLVIALIYLVLCFVFSRIFTFVEKKMAGQKEYALAIEYMENTQ